ncbi:MAG: prolyl oligopeptidase family serine peptidase [Gemmatimonadota bacterium]
MTLDPTEVTAEVPAATPPVTRKSEHVDDYHGAAVSDPYRWLEDDNSPETAAWVTAQNAVTSAYLGRLPGREAIRARLTQLWNYERFSPPVKEGGRYFLFRNNGLQNQSVLYTQTSLADEPRVLLDPNVMSADGTVALSLAAPSRDGKLLAYGTSTSGSDWSEISIRDIEDGTDLPDRLRWVKFSNAAWTRDGQGFFYTRYPEPSAGEELTQATKGMLIYYHRLRTPQTEDRLIFSEPDQPEWYFGIQVTDDGRYLVIAANHGTDPRNRLFYIDLGTGAAPDFAAPVVRLIDRLDAVYGFIDSDGTRFYLHTDLNAPRGRLVAMDISGGAQAPLEELVAESADAIEGAQMINETLVVQYLHDVAARVGLFDKTGKPLRDLSLPTTGSVVGLSGRPHDREMFYAFTSYLYPTTVYRYDFTTGATTVFREPKVPFDRDRYETKQVFYPSKDGTRIPMFVTTRKGLSLDGKNPLLLYAYGGFNVNLTPAFSPAVITWLEMGGVYAVPNLRGGSEYGEAWHQAGMFEKKQTVFDDFVAAAEWLIANGYTAKARLAIQGGSNGGLLVGAVMTQRPDLAQVVLPDVGVMDMLRYHTFTVGWGWVPEYGSSDNPDQFTYLIKYSPLHNLKPGTDYPATLVTTADHDDRVVPAHSFKFAAALQAATTGHRPALIRIETKAGHGGGKPISKQIEEISDLWAFSAYHVGMSGLVS